MFSWDKFLKNLSNNLLGIVNITSDSFSGDGLLNKVDTIPKVFESASKRDIKFLDIGCMSTKPNFTMIETEQEVSRLNTFVQSKNDAFHYSIDSFNPIVAEEALKNNFIVVNDVSGSRNENMMDIIKKYSSGLIICHRSHKSSFLHEKIEYKDVVKDVKEDLKRQVDYVLSKGIRKEQIAIDPGLGFGKTQEQSAKLLDSIDQFVGGYPLVVGYSKKKFTKLLKASDQELFTYCEKQGVSLIRTHFID